MQEILFYFLRSTVSINIFRCVKKFGQYKKSPREKIVKKKITFREIFRSMQNFLELQCLVDGFKIINVDKCFFTLNILFDEVDRDSDMEKNKNWDTIFIIFCYG